MTDREKKYLSDIQQSIHNILSFTENVTSFESYKANFLVKAAVERHLGIIGEAVNKYLRENPNNSLQFAKQIISLRNRIIHSYDNLDDRLIWIVIKKGLPSLNDEVTEKLNS